MNYIYLDANQYKFWAESHLNIVLSEQYIKQINFNSYRLFNAWCSWRLPSWRILK